VASSCHRDQCPIKFEARLSTGRDRTIDDPQAGPYSDPDAIGFIDWEKLDRAKLPPRHSLRVEFEDLTFAEQTALYQAHLQAGRSPRSFRDRYRPVPIEIMRQLHPGVAL